LCQDAENGSRFSSAGNYLYARLGDYSLSECNEHLLDARKNRDLGLSIEKNANGLTAASGRTQLPKFKAISARSATLTRSGWLGKEKSDLEKRRFAPGTMEKATSQRSVLKAGRQSRARGSPGRRKKDSEPEVRHERQKKVMRQRFLSQTEYFNRASPSSQENKSRRYSKYVKYGDFENLTSFPRASFIFLSVSICRLFLDPSDVAKEE
jgi:hypothetical protein